MTRNFNNFTWIIPCDKFLLTITGIIFLWKKIMYFLLFADISFFHRTFCSATQIFFLWQKIPFRAGNLFLLVTTCMFATMCKNSNKTEWVYKLIFCWLQLKSEYFCATSLIVGCKIKIKKITPNVNLAYQVIKQGQCARRKTGFIVNLST